MSRTDRFIAYKRMNLQNSMQRVSLKKKKVWMNKVLSAAWMNGGSQNERKKKR